MPLQPLWEGFQYKLHQTYGVEWMLLREQDSIKGGIVCDEMGLGKTIQMCGLIKESKYKKTLLFAPVAVLEQWKSTAARSSIRCFMLSDSKKSWTLVSPLYKNAPSLYICGYESGLRATYLLKSTEFDRLICDEAHRISHVKTKNFGMISALKIESHWFLTATPIINKLRDLHTLFTLLGLKEVKLQEAVAKYVLARTMDQLRESTPDAPPVPIIKEEPVEFSTLAEKEFYRSIQSNVQRQLELLESGISPITLLMRLRQISIHPQVYIESKKHKNPHYPYVDWIGSSTKFERIKTLLANESIEKHKWIIFCHFKEEMKLLEKELKQLSYIRKIEIYGGDLNNKQRSEALARIKEPFNDTKTCDVLLLQIQSGGVGINLQEFDRIIFTSPWWTKALMDQAIGRAVRIGQQKQVIVYNLLLKEEETLNIDKLMNAKAEIKGELNRKVLSYADNNLSL